jgi:hypothetical protein
MTTINLAFGSAIEISPLTKSVAESSSKQQDEHHSLRDTPLTPMETQRRWVDTNFTIYLLLAQESCQKYSGEYNLVIEDSQTGLH